MEVSELNMIDLVVLLCSLANPAACSEKHFLFESSLSNLDSCMMQAQPYLAQWMGEHPDQRIARYHCAWPEKEGKEI